MAKNKEYSAPCFDDLTEEQLLEEIKKSEEDIDKGRFYESDEFERKTEEFVDALSHSKKLRNAIKKLTRQLDLENNDYQCSGKINVECRYMKEKFNCSPTFKWKMSKKKFMEYSPRETEMLLRRFYKKELNKFLGKCIKQLSKDAWPLYKGISSIVVTLEIKRISKGEPVRYYISTYTCGTPDALEVNIEKL